MRGVVEVFGMEPKEEKILGSARLSCFNLSEGEAMLGNIRAKDEVMLVQAGTYMRLHVEDTLMMTDTRMEKITNTEFIENAKGKVMIAGLGIGLILHNLRDKIASGEVESITIVEKYQDVIDLISPYYTDLPITYITADILNYTPPKELVFDTLYFDIWATICTDNLDQMKDLKSRWKKNLTSGGWVDSWFRKRLISMERRGF